MELRAMGKGWGRVGVLLAAAFVASCDGSNAAPSAAPAGSLVAPDYTSPERFRPSPADQGTIGLEAEKPHVLLAAPERTQSYGAWLYAITPRGLFVVDTSAAAPSAPKQLFPEARPLWTSVDGTALNVIAQVLSDQAANAGQVETRLYRFDLSPDPSAPQLLGSEPLSGTLEVARFGPNQLLTLSTETRRPACLSSWSSDASWRPTGRMVVRDFRLESSEWSLSDEVSVEAEGFIEIEGGVVLTRGGHSGLPAELTVVEVGAEGLSVLPTLTLERQVGAPGARAGSRLALFVGTLTGRSELVVLDLASGAVSSIEVPPLPAGPQGPSPIVFAGRFALVPGLIVDWQSELGPVISAEVPADIISFDPAGERWLGRGTERHVLFRIGAAGTFELEAEFAPPEGSSLHEVTYWDDVTGRVLLPQSLLDSEYGLYPVERRLASLDPAAATPAWQSGPKLWAAPAAGTFRRTDAGLFALTSTDERSGSRDERSGYHTLLERIELAASETEVASLATRTLDVSLADQRWAEVVATFDGRRSARLPTSSGRGSSATELPLDNGAERLERYGDGWLAFSRRTSGACGPAEEMDGIPGTPCLPEGVPAVHYLALDPARVVSSSLLPPQYPIDPGVGRISYEWLGLIVQGEHAAFLQRSGITCQSETDCSALGIPFETGTTGGGFEMCDSSDPVCANPEPIPEQTTVLGYGEQRWLHPLDAESGVFGAALRLDPEDGGAEFSTELSNLGSGVALALATTVERGGEPPTPLRARHELLLIPSLDAPGLEAAQHITVPGAPMYVADARAVSIEPGGPLEVNGPLPDVHVHRLSLRDGLAYVEQTLVLPGGHIEHRWARERGYVLLVPSDICATPSTILTAVSWNGDHIGETGSIELEGATWRLTEASDELVVLTRQIESFSEHALIDVSADGLVLRSRERLPSGVELSVSRDQVRFSTAP